MRKRGIEAQHWKRLKQIAFRGTIKLQPIFFKFISINESVIFNWWEMIFVCSAAMILPIKDCSSANLDKE